jgi:hypothetical protein
MGVDLARPPGRGLTEKQDRYVKLVAHGVNNSEACRTVGINRRTGPRWRFGRTILNTVGETVQYAPVPKPAPSKPRHPRLSVARSAVGDLTY